MGRDVLKGQNLINDVWGKNNKAFAFLRIIYKAFAFLGIVVLFLSTSPHPDQTPQLKVFFERKLSTNKTRLACSQKPAVKMWRHDCAPHFSTH